MCALLGVPIFVIWVVAMPVIALILMYKNVHKNNNIHKYFLILYQGFTTKHFYWEFVNSLRKVLILSSLVLPSMIQVFFSVFILLFTWRLQHYLRPYKNDDHNNLEIIGVNAGMVTLF